MSTKQKIKGMLTWTKLLAPAFMLVLLLPATHALASDITGQEERIIELTNNIRQRVGASTLTPDSRLMTSALQKAQDMAEQGYFSHANSDNQRMSYWINNAGYKYSLAGENLAKGFSSADKLVRAWEKSFSHYVNLVEPKFKHIGIGIATGNFKGKEMVFVVQHFGVEQNSQKKIMSYVVDFTSPLIKFLPQAIATVNTLGDSEEILETKTFIDKPEPVSTGGEQTTKETDGFMILLAIVTLAGIGYVVNYTNANHLSRRILLEKSLKTRGSPHN